MRHSTTLYIPIFLISLIACNKKKRDCGDFTRPLIVSETTSPDSVIVGEPIVSRVSGSLPFLVGQKLSAINASQVSDRNYSIQVNATFPGCRDIALTAMWYFDTSVSVPTNSIGTYILRFDGGESFLYDTVHVIN